MRVRRRRAESRYLLPVAHQHVAACGSQLWTIFLEAGQNSKIALIHQLAAEVLDVARASLLLVVCATISKGASRNRDGQQDERHEKFVHLRSLLQTLDALLTTARETSFIPSPSHGRFRQTLGRSAAAGRGEWRQATGS